MNKKEIPKFKNEDEEREFWQNHDTADYIDWSAAKIVSFPNLKPSTETISLRLPKDLLDQIKVLANKKDVPYQSLMKILLTTQIRQEQSSYMPTGSVAKVHDIHKRAVKESSAVYAASMNQGTQADSASFKVAKKQSKPNAKSGVHSVSGVKKISKSKSKTLKSTNRSK